MNFTYYLILLNNGYIFKFNEGDISIGKSMHACKSYVIKEDENAIYTSKDYITPAFTDVPLSTNIICVFPFVSNVKITILCFTITYLLC